MSIRDEIKKGVACDSVGKPDSAVGRAVCISVHPGKMLLFPLIHWFNMRYKGRYKFARLIFLIDLFLIGIAVALSIVALIAFVVVPKRFEDKIVFEATVAPREVVSGAPSTLVIRYINKTDEELRNAELSMSFPKHFVTDFSPLTIGTIPVGGFGSVHVKGTMFGDVGGEQAFQSRLTFVHGEEKDIFGEKTTTYVFSPVKSALVLILELPEKIIASQMIEGIIKYENTGLMDFPTVNIKPIWPDDFDFVSGNFKIPSVSSGKNGEVRFNGILQTDNKEVTFVFEPSFVFAEDHYKQETLSHTASVIPLPLVLKHSVEKQTVRPGEKMLFVVQYENMSEFDLTNVNFEMDVQSPFVKNTTTMSKEKIAVFEKGTIELSATIRDSIAQSETEVYENLNIVSRPTATYTINDGMNQRVTSKSTPIKSPLTTPIVFDSFARYITASGDQIGRGPVPPELGKETTYWIFWHIGGTINELTDVQIIGLLPKNVRFTGRQTVSQGETVIYDSSTHEIKWMIKKVPTTLSPTSKIIGAAFEVGITPESEDDALLLLKNIEFSAIDDWTGAFIKAISKDIIALLIK